MRTHNKLFPLVLACTSIILFFSCNQDVFYENITPNPVKSIFQGVDLQISIPSVAPWLAATKTDDGSRAYLTTSEAILKVYLEGTTTLATAPINLDLDNYGANLVANTSVEVPAGGPYTCTLDIYNAAVSTEIILQATKTNVVFTENSRTSLKLIPKPLTPLAMTLDTAATGSLGLNSEAWYELNLTQGTYYTLGLTAVSQKSAFLFSSDGAFDYISLNQGQTVNFFAEQDAKYYLGIAALEAGSYSTIITTATGPKPVEILTSIPGLSYTRTDLSNSDVFFIYTNTTTSTPTSPTKPSLTANMAGDTTVYPSRSIPSLTGLAGTQGSTNEKISAENLRLSQALKSSPRKALSSKPVSKALTLSETVGVSTLNFKDDSGNGQATTLRSIIGPLATTEGERALRVWVADDCWTGSVSTKITKVNQSMVDALASRFLKAGAGNDIYDWVSNIFGAEWGDTVYSNTIDPTGIIDIVLFDIDDDNTVAGGTLGYFYSRDNFFKSSYASSNEKIAFALDAVMFADPDGDATWDIENDYWPAEMVATLAHEFQHMVNFYQNLEDTAYQAAWLNELMSMAVEDLLADKIKSNGPRGVAWNDYTAGPVENYNGRLPDFNYYNDIEVNPILWNNVNGSILPRYAMSYAFGAYLIRNYGGPAFLKALNNGNETDNANLITKAIMAQTGETGLTFATVLKRFGAAVLLSRNTNAPERYRFNTGTKFAYSYNGIPYSLGSINLFNYRLQTSATPTYQDGPFFLNAASLSTKVSAYTNLFGNSNTYYLAGSNLTGSKTWSFTALPSGVELTVIVVPH